MEYTFIMSYQLATKATDFLTEQFSTHMIHPFLTDHHNFYILLHNICCRYSNYHLDIPYPDLYSVLWG